jgi:DNA repair/transcription protein MET18/MMS19
MFDIIYCYFPITFRPPPNDPYNITPLDLQQALRKAMSATPRFAPMAMPLFLEKLPASLGESKKDVLRGISACLPIFGDKAIESHSSDLWDSLKTEVWTPPDRRSLSIIDPPHVADLLFSRRRDRTRSFVSLAYPVDNPLSFYS